MIPAESKTIPIIAVMTTSMIMGEEINLWERMPMRVQIPTAV